MRAHPKVVRPSGWFLIAMTFAAPVLAQNWSSFRGTNAGGVSLNPVPVTWDVAKSLNVAWKTPLDGVAFSSPIIWGDRIYVTTAIPQAPPRGEDFRTRHVWKLLSMDRRSGKIVWETAAHDGTPGMQRHPKSSYANSTPATDGRYIVAQFGTEVFACFDMTGKLLWKKELQLKSAGEGFHVGSSPVIVEDLAVLQDDRDRGSYVAAYRLQDGHEIWKVQRSEGPAQSTPAVAWTRGADRRPLVILAGGQYVRALDARSSKEIWRIKTNAEGVSSSPVYSNDLVIFAAGGSKKAVYALRTDSAGDITLASGQRNNAGVAWSTERGGTYIPSPLVVDSQVFVLGDNGVLTSYNLHSGRQIFQQRAGTGDFYASPVAANGRVYIFNTDGEVTVVRATPAFEIIARNSMQEPTMATPAIADGTLYVRTAGHLVALRESAVGRR